MKIDEIQQKTRMTKQSLLQKCNDNLLLQTLHTLIDEERKTIWPMKNRI